MSERVGDIFVKKSKGCFDCGGRLTKTDSLWHQCQKCKKSWLLESASAIPEQESIVKICKHTNWCSDNKFGDICSSKADCSEQFLIRIVSK